MKNPNGIVCEDTNNGRNNFTMVVAIKKSN
jgi:hypothetical protein